jgi:4-amino-4-deoxy-L-arabinose transferase-like glycosyltransferase
MWWGINMTNYSNYRLLPFILILSLALNLWGNRWGMPKYWNPDEITGHAIAMVAYNQGFKPQFFHYGALPYYIVAVGAVIPVLAYSLVFDPPPADLHGLAGTSWKERQKARFIPLARSLSAVMATLVVCFTFIIGMTLFNKGIGYLAAFLLTVSASFVGIAHVATVDGQANFWYWSSCLFALLIWKRGDRRWYILAALTAGLAIGTKIDRIVVLFPLVLSHFLRSDRRHTRNLLLVGIVIAGGYIVANPTLLVSPFEFLDGFTRDFFFNALRGEPGQTSYIWLFNYVRDGLGLPLFATTVAGLAYGLYTLARGKDAAAIVWLLATCIPYYLIIGSLSQVFPRYAILCFPSLMVFTAYGCAAVITRLSQPYTFAAKVMLGSIIGYSFLYTVELILQFSNDPRYQATKWIEQHAPANATIEVLPNRGPVISQEKYRIMEPLEDRERNDPIWSLRDKLARHRLYQKIRQTILDSETWAGFHFGLPVRKYPYRAWFDYFVASYEKPADALPGIRGIRIRRPDYVLLIEYYQQKTLFDLKSPDSGYVPVAQFQSTKGFIIQPPISIQYDLTLLAHRRVYIFQRETSAG